MTIIVTEMQKWKRSKVMWGILFLTTLLGVLAFERACSISRSSPLMDSFGDLYTLAFKNLTSLFLPIVLGLLSTNLFFDEKKNDTLKELLIIPISPQVLYFSKVVLIILLSLSLCLITFVFCVLGGVIAGGFPDLNSQTVLRAALLYLAGGLLIPIAMLPIIFFSTLSKGYVLPIGATLLYLVPSVLTPASLMKLHPLASVLGIYARCSSTANEMVKSWIGNAPITAKPFSCFISIILIGVFSATVSTIAMRRQTF